VIRPATEQDIPHIIRMGRLFWSQTAFGEIPYCPDSIAYIAREMLKMELLLMAEVDGKIAGSVGAVASPLFGNRDVLIASELFWWVEPQFRDSGIGKEMLMGIEQAAKERGVSVFSMMALESVEPEKAAAIYQRLGYSATERAFSKVL
jgi:ribosomal protein S18 acetylase RimI-like enzyme